MKNYLVILFVFIIGLGLGVVISDSTEDQSLAKNIKIQELESQLSQNKKNQKSINSAFENISKEDLSEYINLKTMKEKYQKADEILGKVMLLFLANVHSNVSKDVKQYFIAPRAEIDEEQEADIAVSSEDKKIDVVINPYGNAAIIENENIEDEEFKAISEQLKNDNIDSPYKFFKKAKPITSMEALSSLYGKFEGELYHSRKEQGQSRQGGIRDQLQS